jgi:hypothetical protein
MRRPSFAFFTDALADTTAISTTTVVHVDYTVAAPIIYASLRIIYIVFAIFIIYRAIVFVVVIIIFSASTTTTTHYYVAFTAADPIFVTALYVILAPHATDTAVAATTTPTIVFITHHPFANTLYENGSEVLNASYLSFR